jgi:class 3 adenylate cyclase/tetratricopeptide (TPR) repeat protein
MFCDLVGSTELSASVDPELLTEVYGAYRGVAEDAVVAFEGHVAEYLGDGIVAYFGYPNALENAAELSVHAAHSIIRGVGALEHGATGKLAVRVGIATGVVVAGQLLGGSDMAQVRTVIGDAPNLAARLQSIAEPNQVVVAPSTYALIRDRFALAPLPEVLLKGISGPVVPYVANAHAGISGAVDELEDEGELVGREQEISLLLDRWRSVQEGEGQASLLSGEPGIGKSRLIRAFRSRISEEPHLWLELKASSLHRNSSFRPLVAMLTEDLGIRDEEQLEHLAVEAGWDVDQAVPLLCDLLSIPHSGESDSLQQLTPEGRRKLTLDLLCGWLFQACDERPVVLVAEDLHWMDPSTFELLSMLIDQCPTRSLMLLFTFRLEFQVPWQGLTHVSTLPLRPLRRSEIRQLVSSVLDGVELPKLVLEMIGERTDGVPLFVEELVKSVVETGLVERSGSRFERTDPLPALSIPSTLQDSLMARIDRLGSAKDILQLASVIGREFSYRLIGLLSDLSPAALDQQLEHLVAERIVYQRGTPPHATYVFKHALLQEAAYQSMLNRTRQAQHRHVVEAVRSVTPEVVDREPEVLAHHYFRAGLWRQAYELYRSAEELAGQRYALTEQISHAKRALQVLEQLCPEGEERDSLELSSRIALQGPLIASRGYASAEVRETCERARLLCESIEDGPDVGIAIYGLTTYYLNSGKVAECLDSCQQLFEFAQRQGSAAYLPFAYQQRAFMRYFKGDLSLADEDCRESMALYDPEEHRDLGQALGQDTGPTATFLAAAVAWHLGKPGEAVRLCDRAREMAAGRDDLVGLFTFAMAQQFSIWVHAYRRDREASAEAASEAILLAEKHAFGQLIHQSHCLHAWARSDREPVEALEEYHRSVVELSKIGVSVAGPFFGSLYAEILEANQQTSRALDVLDRTYAAARGQGIRYMDPWMLRARAELMLAAVEPDLTAVRETLRRSIADAAELASPLQELRALTVLLRLGDGSKIEWERAGSLIDRIDADDSLLDLREARALVRST